MLPELLPLLDWKKDFNFLWYVAPRVDLDFGVPSNLSIRNVSVSKILNVTAMAYVSQLAEKVDIPADEVETETKVVANLEYKVPKKIKMNDIVVHYLEDSLNSVYQFHKTWMMTIRSGGLSMNPISELCAQATYVTTEKNLTAAEYIGVYGSLEKLNTPLTSKAIEYIMKPTSVTVYPKIFPIRIQRPSADKSSDGAPSRVTVTYARLPNLNRAHKPLLIMGKDSQWEY